MLRTFFFQMPFLFSFIILVFFMYIFYSMPPPSQFRLSHLSSHSFICFLFVNSLLFSIKMLSKSSRLFSSVSARLASPYMWTRGSA